MKKIEYKTRLQVEFAAPHEKKQWFLVGVFVISVDDVEYEIPIGFWTDFASVPKFFWNIISPYDLGFGPVPHDYGYFTGIKTKAYWDSVFEACMVKDKIPSWKCIAAYKAVDKFGEKTYSKYRRENAQHILSHVSSKSLSSLIWTRNIPLSQFVI
jgi:hypothetical protein